MAIKYDRRADNLAARFALAHLAPGIRHPSAVLQVGDRVVAYGVQQAKQTYGQGSLDLKWRNFDQLPSVAQDIVQRMAQQVVARAQGVVVDGSAEAVSSMPMQAPMQKSLVEPEKIVAATIRIPDGNGSYTMFHGPTHAHAADAAIEAGHDEDTVYGHYGRKETTGFMTNHGRYVDREGAATLARTSGQLNDYGKQYNWSHIGHNMLHPLPGAGTPVKSTPEYRDAKLRGSMQKSLLSVLSANGGRYPGLFVGKIERVADHATLDNQAEDDDHVYHVTSEPNARAILKEGFRPGGLSTRATVGSGGYAGHSKGRTFFTERSGVSYWADRAEEHLEHAHDDPPPVAVLRIHKQHLQDHLEPDTAGSSDARRPAYVLDHRSYHEMAGTREKKPSTAPTLLKAFESARDFLKGW